MKQEISTPSSLRELASSIAVHVTGQSQYRRFQRLYRNDRVGFVYDVLPSIAKTITKYQLEILGLYDSGYNRVAVRGPHGLGKTFLASILTHHSVLTCEEDGKVVTTASAWRQLEKYLWPEIHKTSKKLYWTEIGREPYNQSEEIFNLSIKLNGGTVEAFAVASDDHNTIEGAHGTRLVYVFDEAKTIPAPTWDAAEGAFSNAGLRRQESKEEQFEGLVEEKEGSVVADYFKGEDPEETISRENSLYNEGRREESFEANDHLPLRAGMNSGEGSLYSHTGEYIEKGVPERALRESIPLAVQNSTTDLSLEKNSISHTVDSIKRTPITNLTRNKTQNAYEALAFAISTPGEPSGRFYDIHMHKAGYEDWQTRHVTIDEAIAAGRISKDWVNQRRVQWGENSSIFLNRVLGEFADTSEEGIIPLSWVRAAVERWHTWVKNGKKEETGKRVLGVDVARAGDDKTVIALRIASVIKSLYYLSKAPLTQIAGNLMRLTQGHYLHIEMDGGLGAGVYDILKQDGVPNLRPIIVSGTTTFRDKSKELKFRNVRAAMWWNMRELLDPQYGSDLCLPPDDRLILDLISPKWVVERGAVVTLESKESIKARIGRSTDSGDAVCLAFWQQSSGAGVVF